MKNFSTLFTCALALMTIPLVHGMELTTQMKKETPSLLDLTKKLIEVKHMGIFEKQQEKILEIQDPKLPYVKALSEIISINLTTASVETLNQFLQENRKQIKSFNNAKTEATVFFIGYLGLTGYFLKVDPSFASILGIISTYFMITRIGLENRCAQLEQLQEFSKRPENFIQHATEIKNVLDKKQQERIELFEEINKSKKTVSKIKKTLKNF